MSAPEINARGETVRPALVSPLPPLPADVVALEKLLEANAHTLRSWEDGTHPYLADSRQTYLKTHPEHGGEGYGRLLASVFVAVEATPNMGNAELMGQHPGLAGLIVLPVIQAARRRVRLLQEQQPQRAQLLALEEKDFEAV